MTDRPRRAALVGADEQENLALGYLAAAAEAAGHRAQTVGFDGRDDAPEALRAVLDCEPDLVGVGVPFQHRVEDSLAFVRALREGGYRGHVTCGGHVPTFCYEELLRDEPGLDSAVRHEGEETLVEILEALAAGRPVRDIDGLVWREGGGLRVGATRRPVRDLDSLPPPKRRERPQTVGGAPVGFLLTARGCVGECSYCSIRAFSADAGGPPFRLRDPEAVADEVAQLRRERSVRVVFVEDDLFLLPGRSKAVARLDRLTAALRRRGVRDVAFWIKGRPETIDANVLEAAKRMGAIHVFLGIESASADRLAYLGRTHSPAHGREALRLCRRHRVRPSFNLMLFDPDCTLDDVAATIDLAEEHPDLPWNVCRTEIYPGTGLLARLRAEGRLEGDYRAYAYRMRDVRCEIAFRILRVSFRDRAFACDSLLNRLISLSFSRQVHEHLSPGPHTRALSRRADDLLVEVHRDTVDELRRTLDFAAAGAVAEDPDRVRRFAIDRAMALNARDLGWRARTEELWDRLDADGRALFARIRAAEVASAAAC